MTTDTAENMPSVLGFAILQLFSRMPASGYDLKERFQSSLGRGWHAYDTQIYRELKRLEAVGYTTGEVVKGRSGPQRKLYTITPQGLQALQAWLSTPLDFTKTKDEFLLRVWTLELFPPGEAVDFLLRAQHEWRSALQHEQAALRTLNDSYGEVDDGSPDAIFGRQLGIELNIAMTKARLKWVDRALKVLETRARVEEKVLN
ncbi:DNA-binding PadR family transcriptional regulator [Arthrobacter ginsengisoli]|uniref:DNA-binding PadR family transcriptional regulator n=1 Tax=Arthrobacter ginsengisoli TaxID=1356565 RepID=A0ABU1UDQ0_9MICC|nr:PadR family transcriptional regulator [Arthrobacter ginsengisoli]MDR7083255.1 DNA-binding PadR family transcriptional regulator [Arthrobacter ginsengisoli]